MDTKVKTVDYSSKEYFDKMTAYWRAANYISVGQALLEGQPAAGTAAEERRRQAASDRPLGHDCWAELHLYPLEPGDQ